MEIPKYVLEAQEAFRNGGFVGIKYDPRHPNRVVPENIGDVAFDPHEGVWVMRTAQENEPFSCGEDCCGIHTYQVSQISED